MSNQQLEIKVRRREELESAKNANNTAALSNTNTQLLNSLCAANSLVLAENFQALTAHNKNLLNRVAQLADKVRFISIFPILQVYYVKFCILEFEQI